MGILGGAKERILLSLLVVGLVAVLPAVAVAQAPGVEGYGSVAGIVVEVTTPVVVEVTTPEPPVVLGDPIPPEPAPVPEEEEAPVPEEEGEVAGEEAASPVPAAGAPSAPAAAPAGKLPFTGLQVGLMAAVGLGLLGMGLALRRMVAPQLRAT